MNTGKSQLNSQLSASFVCLLHNMVYRRMMRITVQEKDQVMNEHKGNRSLILS